MRGGADTHFNGRQRDSLAVLRNYARRLYGVSGSGLLGVGLAPTTDYDGDGDGDNSGGTRTGREKVGLAPTERDDNEEGLAPSTAGLNDKMWDYTPATRENGLSLMLRSPRSFREMSRSLCDLYDSTTFTVQGTLPCTWARVWGTGPGTD
ncbi:hypothetical protein EDB86DRAFT_2830636 [Lactarius hatsudake]|nr:hypothetical protein EDB86DRAFT_2830636 [Lactarius hatsudake]